MAEVILYRLEGEAESLGPSPAGAAPEPAPKSFACFPEGAFAAGVAASQLDFLPLARSGLVGSLLSATSESMCTPPAAAAPSRPPPPSASLSAPPLAPFFVTLARCFDRCRAGGAPPCMSYSLWCAKAAAASGGLCARSSPRSSGASAVPLPPRDRSCSSFRSSSLSRSSSPSTVIGLSPCTAWAVVRVSGTIARRRRGAVMEASKAAARKYKNGVFCVCHQSNEKTTTRTWYYRPRLQTSCGPNAERTRPNELRWDCLLLR